MKRFSNLRWLKTFCWSALASSVYDSMTPSAECRSAVLFIDHRLEIGGQQRGKGLLGLILQFESVDQEQDAPGVARAQEELDDGGGGQRLAGAGGHLEQKAVFTVLDRPLQGVDGLEL